MVRKFLASFSLMVFFAFSCKAKDAIPHRVELAKSFANDYEFNKSISELRSVIFEESEKYGSDDTRTKETILLLAGVLYAKEQFNDARKLVNQLVSGKAKAGLLKDSVYCESKLLLAMMENATGNPDSAIKYLQESLSNLPPPVSKDNLLTAAHVYEVFSSLFADRGDIQKAKEYANRIGNLAHLHPEIQELLFSYKFQQANVLLSVGKPAQAETILRSVPSDLNKAAKIPETSMTTIALSKSLDMQGRNDEAYQIVAALLGAIERTKGKKSGLLIAPLVRLAFLENKLGRKDVSKEHLNRAKRLSIGTYGQEHSILSDIDLGLATLSYDSGNREKALRILLLGKNRIEKNIGINSPKLMPILENISNLQRIMGDMKSATASLAQLLSIQKKVLVKGHRSIEETERKIGWLQKQKAQ